MGWVSHSVYHSPMSRFLASGLALGGGGLANCEGLKEVVGATVIGVVGMMIVFTGWP